MHAMYLYQWLVHVVECARMLPDWGNIKENETVGKFATLFQFVSHSHSHRYTKMGSGKILHVHFSVEIIDKCCQRKGTVVVH